MKGDNNKIDIFVPNKCNVQLLSTASYGARVE